MAYQDLLKRFIRFYATNIAHLDHLYREYLDNLDFFYASGLKKEVNRLIASKTSDLFPLRSIFKASEHFNSQEILDTPG
jgi:hypothetical protein